MSIVGHILNAGLAKRRRHFDAMMAQPEEYQRQALARKIREGRRTAFGAAHEFGRIRGYEDFRRHVPLRNYDDLSPWISATWRGERNVLAEGKPRYWARTSGTTGVEKRLPIYDSGLRQSSSTFETALALHLAVRPEAARVTSKVLFLGSCAPLVEVDGWLTGFMSSIVAREMSPLVRRILLPGTRVDHLSSWEEKMRAILEMALDADISIAAGMPSWLTAFFQYAYESTGRRPCELWPGLSLVLHSGVSIDSYRAPLQRLFPPGHGAPFFRNAYAASEGNFSIEDGHGQGMLLLTDTIFYELVPVDAYLAGKGEQARRPLTDARCGEDYVLVLTTPGGLHGYVIGDTIRFTSTSPYRIELSGRTGEMLNVAGEKVSGAQIVHAAVAAARATSASLVEFTVFSNRDEHPHGTAPHEWVVEFSNAPANPEEFMRRVDDELATLNELYALRRRARIGGAPLLPPPRLRVAPNGAYARWQANVGRQGGHFKVPRVSRDPAFYAALCA